MSQALTVGVYLPSLLRLRADSLYGISDFLQYTVTSRKDMPNERFCEELKKASQDLYDLHADATPQKSNL